MAGLWGSILLHQGLLPRGERVRLGDLSFEFPDLRYWAYFGVTRDPGEGVLVLGFSLGILGLAIRLVWNERSVTAAISHQEKGSVVELVGRAHYFPALFREEIKRLCL